MEIFISEKDGQWKIVVWSNFHEIEFFCTDQQSAENLKSVLYNGVSKAVVNY